MDYKNLPEKVRKLLDKYINGFFGLGDLNYIKPFRRLIHMILYRIHNAEVRLDEIEDSPTMEEFEDLEKRVETNEGNIDGLEENKVDKSDFEDLEAHVDDIDSEIDDLQTQIDDTNDDLSALEERVKTNEDNIEDLDEKKADKTALEETNNRVTELEDCCEEVGQHLEEVDGRLDKDEDNIDTLLDNMIVLTGHDGIIATDVYFENIYEIKIDDLLMQMLNAGIMEYCVYTACYDEWDNWVKQIQGAVKSIYDYEWNNFAFINVKAVHFGGTSPRPMIELIPRERDVYICLDYTGDDFVGHCFMHRTDLKELEERMTAAEGRLDTDEANIAQNTSDIERLTTDMEHTGERLTDIENAITALQKADDDFETRISYLEECCGDVKDTIGHLEDDIEDCRKHADAATEQAEQAAKDAEDAKDAAEEAEKKAEDAAEKVDEFDERITTNTKNIEELQNCCEEVQGEITDIKQTADDAKDTADGAKSEADDVSVRVEAIENAYVKRVSTSETSYQSNGATDYYVELSVTDQDDTTHSMIGSVSTVRLSADEDSDGQTVYTLYYRHKAPQTGGAGTEVTVGTITVPAGFDPSEIEAQLQEIVDKVNNDESDLEELKTTIENINDTITNLETKVEELEGEISDLKDNKADKTDLDSLKEEIEGEIEPKLDEIDERIDTLEAQPMELQGTLIIDWDDDLYEGDEFSGTVQNPIIICLDATETDAFEYMDNNDIDYIDAYFALDSVRKYKVEMYADGSIDGFTDAIDDYGVFAIDSQSAVIQYSNGKTRLIHNSIAGYALNVHEVEYKNFEVYNADNKTIKLYHRKVKEIPEAGSTYEGETVTASKEFNLTSTSSSNSVLVINTPQTVLGTCTVEIVDDGFEANGAWLFGVRDQNDGYAGNISKIIGLDKLNTSKMTSMRYMFTGDSRSEVTELDLSTFDTSNVTDMHGMFYASNNLTKLDISSFDTTNVTDIGYMFGYCAALTELDVSSFHTSNVTNMANVFYTCTNIDTIYSASDQFNLDNVTTGGQTFYRCSSLSGGSGTTIDAGTDYTLAHVDGGTSNPGLFTEKK